MKQIPLIFALFCYIGQYAVAQSHSFLPFQQGKLVGFKDSTDKTRIPPTFDYALPFSDGLALVRKGNDIYFINEQGKKAFPFSFDMAESFENGLSRVRIKDKYGFIDTKGDIILPVVYNRIQLISRNLLYLITSGDKKGFFDGQMKKIIAPPQYTYLYGQENGDVLLSIDHPKGIDIYNKTTGFIGRYTSVNNIYDYKNGFISYKYDNLKNNTLAIHYDPNGKEIEPSKLISRNQPRRIVIERDKKTLYNYANKPILTIDSAGKFLEQSDVMIKYQEKGKYGFVDTSGQVLIPAIYPVAENFEDGLALIRLPKPAYINKQGKMVTDTALYDDIYFRDKQSIYINKGGKCGVINAQGYLILLPIYSRDSFSNAGSSSGNIFIKNEKKGLVSSKGRVIIPAEYDDIQTHYNHIATKNGQKTLFSREGGILLEGKDNYSIRNDKNFEIIIGTLNNKEHYYDKMGRELIPPICDNYFLTTNYNFITKKGNKYSIFDTKQGKAIPFQYDMIQDIASDRYIAKKKEHFKLIDGKNTLLTKYNFSAIHRNETQKKELLVKYKGKYGTIDYDGKTIIPFQYDTLKVLSEEFTLAGKYINNQLKYGILNEKKELFIPVEYDEIRTIGYNHYTANYRSHRRKTYTPANPTEQLAFSVKKDNKWGAISNKGRLTIPIGYTNIGYFYNDIAKIYMDSLFGFINPKGEIITSPIYQEIDTIKSNIQAYWVKKDGKYGIIDAVGKVLINFGYDELIKTVDPTVYILKGYNKYGFLRPYDEYLINSSYDTLFEAKQPYTNSYLGENLYQIINADGDEVGQIRAGCNDGVGKFITYIAKMYGKYALINQNEQEITPFEYEDLYEVKGIPHYFAKINHKYGIMDKNGKAVIPYIYDSIYFDEKSSFKATLNNKTYHYDLKGNCLDCPKD